MSRALPGGMRCWVSVPCVHRLAGLAVCEAKLTGYSAPCSPHWTGAAVTRVGLVGCGDSCEAMGRAALFGWDGSARVVGGSRFAIGTLRTVMQPSFLCFFARNGACLCWWSPRMLKATVWWRELGGYRCGPVVLSY